ncbi:Sensor protein ZraS [Roseimaritima multifibrata]|uniref:histidine kinase n=1 Tax=Roseimaritima multifibrata TaxID=1930274 RepID=A0A517MEX1_9BACT|nr:ATP-binding protein [Roseimaritima multifibrata]QDS93317.1 Sensor protein ZraS [Roseimaritima multifibrata]
MASLFVIRGRDQGRHFPLEMGRITIGRDPTNAIQLLDSEVSREHAAIRSENGIDFSIADLSSSNGSEVNGGRITEQTLQSGDRILIGQTLMIFTGSSRPASLEAAHSVDIVQQASFAEASQIVSSAELSSSNASGDSSLEVMYLTALAVGRTTEIPELLDRVLHLVFDWVVADRGCVMLLDSETGELRPAARCDRNDKKATEPISISRTILDYVMEHKEAIRTSDATDDQRWNAAQSIVQAGIREALCVPLQGRYGIVGALYVDTYTSPGNFVAGGQIGRFNDDQLRLLTAIGYQAALAIEDTFYYSAMMQSERLAVMGQTIANLSHHIKNILQGIRGGGYLIDTGLKREDNDAVRRGWGMVEKNQERISNLVMDMLTFSKERQPERVLADLNETVCDVVELMLVRAAECRCDLKTDLQDDMPLAFFDPEAIHRALLNLVTNAIDAASEMEQPEVCVRTLRTADQGCAIEVADNGPGIPVEQRANIFSPFESGKGARGTGLGLPVCKKIIEEHKGELEIEDVASGGTLFRIQLPPPPELSEEREGGTKGDDPADDSHFGSHDTIA